MKVCKAQILVVNLVYTWVLDNENQIWDSKGGNMCISATCLLNIQENFINLMPNFHAFYNMVCYT